MSRRPESLRRSAPTLGRLLRRFSPELREQRPLVLLSFGAIFAEVALRLLEPWPLAVVIDHVLGLGSADASAPLGGLASLTPTQLLGLAAAALLVFAGLRALAAYLSAVGFALAGNRLLTQIRNRLYVHLQGLSVSFHTRARSGDLVLRVIGDVGMMRDVLVTAVMPLLASVFVLAGMLAVMFLMQWQLTLIALATVPLFWISTVRLGSRIREHSAVQRRREGTLANQASETLGGVQTVQALALDEGFAEAFAQQAQGSLREGVKGRRLAARLERSVDVLVALATALVLYFGARTALQGRLSPGELVVFMTYLKSAARPVRNFAKYTARVAKASAAADRVLEVLDREQEVVDLPGAAPAPALRGSVDFDAASFGYGEGESVLRGVDLHVAAGEQVAIVGPSGSGKSTLVAALMRLHDPREGAVRIDGVDVRGYTLASLRAQVSVVLQDTVLFATSVRENIGLGAPAADEAAILAAARLAGAHEFIEALPEGYDSRIGERGLTLSAGQRQRIAIARAAVRAAPIVILDEPLSGLDEANARAVAEALARLTANRTTFLVTHEREHAERCDRVVVLQGGRIAEQGSPRELAHAGGAFAELFRDAPATAPRPHESHAVGR